MDDVGFGLVALVAGAALVVYSRPLGERARARGAAFGRELYVPWQLTQGKVLYRDIESIFGPLSPYLNALWMRLFPSLTRRDQLHAVDV